jgi:hypothetical protein
MFEIYFYTAATRLYGNVIVEILKLEIFREIGNSLDLTLKRRIENTFVPSRLISRDDKKKYQECN